MPLDDKLQAADPAPAELSPPHPPQPAEPAPGPAATAGAGASGTGAAIGVYDSGVGGLSVLRALREALPRESFVYVADSGHAPYGGRSQAELEARAQAVVGFLVQHGVKAVVLACNTVSIAAAAALRATHSLPIIAMEPAIKPAVRMTRSGTVLVLGTEYTVHSESVQRLCRLFGDEVRILLQACPGLVERVERGELASDTTRQLLDAYIRPHLEAGADTLVLGCTHYAFLADTIRELAGPEVAVVEPSAAVGRQLTHRLLSLGAPRHGRQPGLRAYSSGDVEGLRRFLDLTGLRADAVERLVTGE